MCRLHRRPNWLVAALCAAALVGCACRFTIAQEPRFCGGSRRETSREVKCHRSRMLFPERLQNGYTLVLPGIWGDQSIDSGIVNGLQDAELDSAIEIYDWTAGPTRMLYNLRNLPRNCAEAHRIATRLLRYQQSYPGRPVNLIGYSGGGGLVVLTLEALPPGCQISTAVMLAPTLAADYDLRLAMSHVEGCVHNFYSPLDVPVMMVGCTIFGTTEGRHGPAAGAIGFCPPPCLSPRSRRAWHCKLSQTSFTPSMAGQCHFGGHFGWANRAFVAQHVAPLLAVEECWPAEEDD